MVGVPDGSVSYLVGVYDIYTGKYDAASNLAGKRISCGGAAADGGLSVPSFFEGRGGERRLYTSVLPDACELPCFIYGNHARSDSFGLWRIGVSGFSEKLPFFGTNGPMRTAQYYICACVYFDSIAGRRMAWSIYCQ